jgi:hypothetical protein
MEQANDLVGDLIQIFFRSEIVAHPPYFGAPTSAQKNFQPSCAPSPLPSKWLFSARGSGVISGKHWDAPKTYSSVSILGRLRMANY